MLAFLGISALVWFRDRLAWVLVAVGLSSWLFSLGTAEYLDAVASLSSMLPWYPRSPRTILCAHRLRRRVLACPFSRSMVACRRPTLQASRWATCLPTTRSLRITGAVLSAVTVSTLIPLGAAYSYPFVINHTPMPPWFHHVAPRLVPGTVVLAYPYPGSLEQQAMAWQAVDGHEVPYRGRLGHRARTRRSTQCNRVAFPRDHPRLGRTLAPR